MGAPMTNRRNFIRLSVLGGAALAAGCGGGGGSSLTCTDTTGLAPADTALRTSQQYSDASTHGADKCSACRFYTAAAEASACGSCQVLRGPIHPDGWCTLFARA